MKALKEISYVLTATIDGKRAIQGEYSSMEQVASRIVQLNTEYRYLDVSRPTRYVIDLLEKEI